MECEILQKENPYLIVKVYDPLGRPYYSNKNALQLCKIYDIHFSDSFSFNKTKSSSGIYQIKLYHDDYTVDKTITYDGGHNPENVDKLLHGTYVTEHHDKGSILVPYNITKNFRISELYTHPYDKEILFNVKKLGFENEKQADQIGDLLQLDLPHFVTSTQISRDASKVDREFELSISGVYGNISYENYKQFKILERKKDHTHLQITLPEKDAIKMKISSSVSVDSDSLKSPLEQASSGIDSQDILCNNGYVLVQKYDGSTACVKSETKQELVERGWSNKSSTITETTSKTKQHPTVIFPQKCNRAISGIHCHTTRCCCLTWSQ